VVLTGKRYGHHTASPYGVSIYEIAGSNLLSIYIGSLPASVKTNKIFNTEKASDINSLAGEYTFFAIHFYHL
jgi:hypothetical protein